MKRIFNIILFTLFCTSFAQAQVGKTFGFTYEGQTLRYEIISETDVAVGKQERTSMHTSFRSMNGIVSRDTVYSGPAGDVTIPSEVTFEGKSYKVTSIIKDAFEINPYLKSVSLPGTLYSIDKKAWGHCPELEQIEVSPDNQYYSSEDGVLFNKAKDTLIAFPMNKKNLSYIVPNTVKRIEPNTLYDIGFLEKIEVAADNQYYSSEDGVLFNKAKDSLLAFPKKRGNLSYVVPNTVKWIEPNALYNSIGFLEKIEVAADNQYYSSEDGVLFNKAKDTLLLFPLHNKMVAYEIPKSVTCIRSYAFFSENLKSVTIPKTVKSIGTNVFWNSAVESVVISQGAKMIGDFAFANCSSLKNVSIPQSVVAIGTGAFFGCDSLERVVIPQGVKTIGEAAFAHCRKLKTVSIPKSVTEIGGWAFVDCGKLDSVKIPKSVDRICKGTFACCKTLSNLEISKSVRSIADSAFIGCVDLDSVMIPKSVNSVGADAFNRTEHNLSNIDFQTESKKRGGKETTVRHVVCSLKEADWIVNKRYNIKTDTWTESRIKKPVKETTVIVVPDSKYERWKKVFEKSPKVKVVGAKQQSQEGSELSATRNATVVDTCIVNRDGDTIRYNLDMEAKTASVTYKGKDRYSNNKYSGSITIPKKVKCNGEKYRVTAIGRSAFLDCAGLTSVTIPSSVTTIDEEAFMYCTSLTSVTIPNSVTTIGERAFYNCDGLTSVTLPNSVSTIGEYAFAYCKGLTSVTLPNSVTTIGERAFYNCDGLTSVTLPNSVTMIDEEAFMYCTSLTSVTIPNSVTTIGKSAFAYCKGLTCVTLPNSVTTIGELAFGGSGLTSVKIPNSVTTIGNDAFGLCRNLKNINVSKGNSHYSSENGVLFDITKKTLIQCPRGIKGIYAIPNSVTTIGDAAFRFCESLTSVTIPNSVTTIGERAFYNCDGLTSVTLPNSVTTIGEYVFAYCKGLTSVTLPNSVTTIGEWAFSNCTSLTSVAIPNSVTTIGTGAFHSCDGLSSVTIPNSVTTIGTGAFHSCDGLSSVTIPNSVTTIDKDAFRECKGLINVTIPNSVTTIGNDAFGLCRNLKNINVSKGNSHYSSENGVLFDITKKRLIQCPCGIKGNYAIPNGVTTIEDGAFLVCAGLTSVTIPNSVTTIGYAAFGGSGLTSVTIPNSVTKIDIDAFRECSVLTNVTIGNSITTIETNAFLKCTGLTILTIENATPPEIYGHILSDVAKNMTIYVPAESVEKYKTAGGWSRYADKIKAIEK